MRTSQSSICIGSAVGLAFVLASVALGVAISKHSQTTSSSLRVPLTNVPDVPGTALVITFGNQGQQPVDTVSDGMILHFHRTGNIVSLSLEAEATGLRTQVTNFGFSLSVLSAHIVFVIDPNIPGIDKYISPCYGSFGNRLLFTPGQASDFQHNEVSLIQSSVNNLIFIWPVARDNTFSIPWQLGQHYIPAFSFSYGAPSTSPPCDAAAVPDSIEERVQSALSIAAP